MKILRKELLTILSLSTMLIFTACTSNQNVLSVSEAHYYNDQFGLNESQEADYLLEAEIVAMYQEPAAVEPQELVLEPGTFLAEDYVQTPEVISYKYKFDPKFYATAEWRKMP
jgi:hypothetical protein